MKPGSLKISMHPNHILLGGYILLFSFSRVVSFLDFGLDLEMVGFHKEVQFENGLHSPWFWGVFGWFWNPPKVLEDCQDSHDSWVWWFCSCCDPTHTMLVILHVNGEERLPTLA